MYSVESDTENLKISLCFGCLSFDRKLKPLGEKLNIFCMLVNDTYSKFSDVLLCWECMAVLRKVELFKEKVDHAQTVLSFYPLDSESMLPESLSTLAFNTQSTPISKPLNDFLDLDFEIKEENEKNIPETEIIKPDVFVAVTANLNESVAESIEFDSDNDNMDQIQGSVSENSIVVDDAETSSIDRVEKPKRKSKKTVKEDTDYIPEEIKPIERNMSGPKTQCFTDKKNTYSKVINREYDDHHKYIKKVKVDTADMLACVEKDRNSVMFRSIKYKCEKCVLSLGKEEVEKHAALHIKSDKRKLICYVCEQTFKNERGQKVHMARHNYLRQCLVCDTRICTTDLAKLHLKSHTVKVQCTNCTHTFTSKLKFYQHYNDTHSKFICDYCGITLATKHLLIKHIVTHVRYHCKECNKYYKNQDRHIKIHHTTQNTERAFCVECNIQFKNLYAYKEHIYTSVVHNREKYEKVRQERYACPDCPKVYRSRHALKNHNDFIHKGVSRYICPHCNLQVLSASRLSEHIKAVHLKLKPERNKMCYICGRGFSTNKVLTHHIRTHTGERPHQCPHCDASFAQPTAMKTHIKNIHLKTAGGVVS